MSKATMKTHRHGRKVLLVEDDLALCELVALVLGEAGYAIEAVQDGGAALSILESRASEFYAVVLDLMLPDIPGRLVLVRSKQLRPELPVIVATGNASAAGAGADRVIQKPYGPNDVVDALDASAKRRVTHV
jgi:DNA-binding response OmpR family regulator